MNALSKPLAILATFAHEVRDGVYTQMESGFVAQRALERAGLLNLDDVVALSAPSAGPGEAPSGIPLEIAKEAERRLLALYSASHGATDDSISARLKARIFMPDLAAAIAAASLVQGEPQPVARWVNLTDEDRDRAFNTLPDMLDGFLKKWGWLHFAKAIEAECRAKNPSRPPVAARMLGHAELMYCAGARTNTYEQEIQRKFCEVNGISLDGGTEGVE